VATLQSLSSRLRAEIGDTGRTFIDTFTGDGITTRFKLTQAPIQGDTIVVKVDTEDVSYTTTIEEGPGVLTLLDAPESDAVITVAGVAFRYFTDSDIQYYVNSAYAQHSLHSTDSNSSQYTLSRLPVIDEYPIIILASSLALYTLATDAAFDINIFSPDGVTIPRSERYHQLMEIVEARRTQYKELCSMLNLGIYRMEVLTLRRISRLTNRYIPIYRPQELDDWSLPQRVALPMPSYRDETPVGAVTSRDLHTYSGDDFRIQIKFSLNLATYSPKAEIRIFQNSRFSQVGPVIVGTFLITKIQSEGQEIYDTLQLTLTGIETAALPRTAYYDLQLTDADGKVKTYIQGKVYTQPQVTL